MKMPREAHPDRRKPLRQVPQRVLDDMRRAVGLHEKVTLAPDGRLRMEDVRQLQENEAGWMGRTAAGLGLTVRGFYRAVVDGQIGATVEAGELRLEVIR